MVAVLCFTKPMKIHIGLNELGWYRKVTVTIKQCKIARRNTYYCAKKEMHTCRRPHLDIKEVKILTESDVLEDIKMGIETGFEVKIVEHKE